MDTASFRQERDRLRPDAVGLLDDVPEGVFVVDREGRVIVRNRRAAELLGPSCNAGGEAAAGFTLRTLDGDAGGASPMLRALEGETVRGEVALLVSATRVEAPVLVSGAPVHDESGEIVGAAMLMQDIAAMREAAATRERFFAFANHELKSPLTTVRAQMQRAARQLRNGAPPEEVLGSLDRADRAIDEVLEIADDLVRLSGLTTRMLALRRERFGLRELVDSVVARLADSDGARRITVEGADADVDADPRRITEVVENLVSNAVKYGGGTAVGVSIAVGDGETVLRVSDGGGGIAAEDVAHLFEPFYRGANAGDRPGNGLGLALCREVARLHGGRLWLERTSEEGSVFALALPLAT